MEVRPAQPEDADAIRRLVREAYALYVPRLGREPGPMGDDYGGRVAAGQAWVAVEDGAVLGALVLERLEAGVTLLDNIAVSPAAQGRGLGRALMGFAEAEAARRGCTELRLYTHVLMTENLALYGRLGFVETGRVTEKGFDRVYMSKAL